MEEYRTLLELPIVHLVGLSAELRYLLVSAIGMILTVMGFVIFILSVREKNYGKAPAGLMISAAGVFVAFGLPSLLPLLSSEMGAEGKSPESALETPAGTTSPTPGRVHVEQTPVDWGTVLTAGGIVLAILVFIVGAIIIHNWNKAYSLKKAAERKIKEEELKEAEEERLRLKVIKEKNKDIWEAYLYKEKVIGDSFYQFSIDQEKALNLPLMRMMDNPLVLDIVRLRAKAGILRPESLEGAGAMVDLMKDPYSYPYISIVEDFERAYNLALADAKKKKWSVWTSSEQKMAKTAIQMAKLAFSDGTPITERRVAFKRLEKTMQELAIPITDPQAKLEVETTMKNILELE